jgi:hypothetical protein
MAVISSLFDSLLPGSDDQAQVHPAHGVRVGEFFALLEK